jgi:glycosyltransferase involved in cell wall biosynthesis
VSVKLISQACAIEVDACDVKAAERHPQGNSQKESGMDKGRYKIIRVIDRVVVGGPTKHVVLLCSRLDKSRFHSLLVTGSAARGETPCLEYAAANGVEVEVFAEMSREVCWQDLRVIARLYRLFLRERPDLVHTHKSKAGAVGRIAALLYRLTTPSILLLKPRRLKTLHTFHGHVLKGYFGRWRTRAFVVIERMLARWGTDRLLVVSEQQRRELLSEFKIGRAGQFVVMRLGVDMETGGEHSGEFRRRHGIAAHEFVLASVGRFAAIKNLDLLLRMFASLVSHRPALPIRLVLVGDGELHDSLLESARLLGIADKVVFAGMQEDCMPLYREFDLLAITSNNEGTPLAMIEALSQGCAVVSTEVGGVVDLMGCLRAREGAIKICDHGVMVPAGDAESLQRAVECLIADPALRRQSAKAGRAFVRNWYSAQRLAGDMESLYGELLDGPPEMANQGALPRKVSRRSPKGGEAMPAGN